MIVVPDTDVLVAAIAARGLCAEVVTHGLRYRLFVSSPALLAEFDAVLRRKFEMTPAVRVFLDLLGKQLPLVDPAPLKRAVCRDPDDDTVLATAVTAKAGAIVTGDADLLVLRNYRRIDIITPREYLIRFVDGFIAHK